MTDKLEHRPVSSRGEDRSPDRRGPVRRDDLVTLVHWRLTLPVGPVELCDSPEPKSPRSVTENSVVRPKRSTFHVTVGPQTRTRCLNKDKHIMISVTLIDSHCVTKKLQRNSVKMYTNNESRTPYIKKGKVYL